jgi:hypothetical protein
MWHLQNVEIDEYCEIMCIKRRNLYYKIKSDKIKSFKIGKHVFAIINDNLKLKL